MIRTLEEPFGALQIPARYVLQGCALMGWRFSKIIVFRPPTFLSRAEEDNWQRWVNEDCRTKLDVDCLNNLYVV